ncbi:MAG TPA: ROK family transcriptional regulator [Ardenticatenaceae bacterium]|jgi:predicted NBD/HSP70 family sugar kinase
MKKATRQQTKDHNSRLVLRTIYHSGEISRADIARTTHLTPPTVSSIVAELIDSRFVVETGQGPSAGGKPPTLLNIAHDAHQLLCLDLGSQTFRGALVNLRGEIVGRSGISLVRHRQGDALQLVYDLVEVLTDAATAPLLGIAIGTPGLIDPEQGIVRRAVNLGWAELPLRQLLEERYEKPVYVANDSHMAALAEYTFGDSRESNNLIVVKVGQGIGAGIVLDGHIYYGDGLGAGEIGHLVVAENGEPCSCGNMGCLETTTSTRAILRRATTILRAQGAAPAGEEPEISWEAVVHGFEGGNGAIHEMIVAAGKHLGVALASLVAGLNIQRVVVAGRVSQFGEALLDAAHKEMTRRVLPTLAAKTDIRYATLGSDIVLLGCSAMLLKHELQVI